MFCSAYIVASTRRTVRLTSMTISMWSAAKTLVVKLMVSRRIVGTKTVSKLLIIGLPNITSTIMAFFVSMLDLHIRILLKV